MPISAVRVLPALAEPSQMPASCDLIVVPVKFRLVAASMSASLMVLAALMVTVPPVDRIRPNWDSSTLSLSSVVEVELDVVPL